MPAEPATVPKGGAPARYASGDSSGESSGDASGDASGEASDDPPGAVIAGVWGAVGSGAGVASGKNRLGTPKNGSANTSTKIATTASAQTAENGSVRGSSPPARVGPGARLAAVTGSPSPS